MKKTTQVLGYLAGLVIAVVASAGDIETADKQFLGVVDLDGGFKIDGVRVTATATELNNAADDAVPTYNAVTVTTAKVMADIVFTNAETIDNQTDKEVRITYDDTGSAVLGRLKLANEAAMLSLTNGDYVDIVLQTYDSTTAATEWVSTRFQIDDKTGASEDGAFCIEAFVGGTLRELVKIAAAITIGGDNNTLALGSSDWDIDASGNASGLGNVGADGSINLGTGTNKFVIVGASGNTLIAGTLDLTGILTVTSNIVINAATVSTSKDNGALVIANGGVGIEDDLNVGDRTDIGGALGVTGGLNLGTGTNKVVIVGASGNMTVAGTFGSSGTLTASSNIVCASPGIALTGAGALFSNDTAILAGTRLEIKAGGSVDLPAASLASDELPATIADSTLVSNAALKVHANTMQLKSGGTMDIAGVEAMVAPSTVRYLTQVGTFTNSQPTVSFGVVFGAGVEPTVICGWVDDISAITTTGTSISVTSINTTNFVPKTPIAFGTANAVNAKYIAVGKAP